MKQKITQLLNLNHLKIALLTTLCLATNGAFSSTFVGNGGSFSESSLRLTVEGLKSTLRDMKEYEFDCDCKISKEIFSCNYLEDLTEQQREDIAKFIAKSSGATISKLRKAKFYFTDDTLLHHDNDKQRKVSAGTKGKNTVLLNEMSFLKRSPSRRAALVFHEIGHILGDDFPKINDNKEFKSFKEGRNFLDAAGICVAHYGVTHKFIQPTKAWENIPKAWHRHWVKIGGLDADIGDPNNQLHSGEARSGSNYSYRYQPSSFGFEIRTGSSTQAEVRQNINSDLSYSHTDLVATYRIAPFDTNLVRLNQSHFLVKAGGRKADMTHKISDEYLSYEASASNTSLVGSAEYLFPVYSHAWISISRTWSDGNFKFEETGTELKGGFQSTSAGLGISF